MSGTPTDADRVRALSVCRCHIINQPCTSCDLIAHLIVAVRAEATEATWLDERNAGSSIVSEKLRKIAEHGRDAGVFGGEAEEAAAQAILTLRAERDAALAQLNARVDRTNLVYKDWEPEQQVRHLEARVDYWAGQLANVEALLAQREAEVSALHSLASDCAIPCVNPPCWCGSGEDREHDEFCRRAKALVTDTAPAVLAYATTLKAEGAREEREACAKIADQRKATDGCDAGLEIAAAIRERG